MVPPDPVWVGSITVRAGDFHVGIRTDDPSVLASLRAAYSEAIVDDEAVQADYAVSTSGGPVGATARLLPYVAHGRCPLLRSRQSRRLLRRLDLELGSLSREMGTSVQGTLGLYGMSAVVGVKGAALVPTHVVERSTATERRLREAGVGIVEDAALRLDPLRQEIVVLPGLLEEIPPAWDDGLAVPPGRHPVAGVFWSAQEIATDERAAIALVRLLGRVDDRAELDRGTMLEGLAVLARMSSPDGLGRTGTADLVPLIALVT